MDLGEQLPKRFNNGLIKHLEDPEIRKAREEQRINKLNEKKELAFATGDRINVGIEKLREVGKLLPSKESISDSESEKTEWFDLPGLDNYPGIFVHGRIVTTRYKASGLLSQYMDLKLSQANTDYEEEYRVYVNFDSLSSEYTPIQINNRLVDSSSEQWPALLEMVQAFDNYVDATLTAKIAESLAETAR